MQKSLNSPFTNRGVVNTYYVLFDWFECTFLDENFMYNDTSGEWLETRSGFDVCKDLFEYLFDIDYKDLVIEYKGVNGYNCTLSFKNIKLLFNFSRPDMGIHLLMSGSACRDFEELGLDYQVLFSKINSYQVNYNRIDVSIDDFRGEYFNLQKLVNYVLNDSLATKFKSVLSIIKYNTYGAKELGNSLQFGSRASNIQITFYDKLLERKSKDILVDTDITSWIRTETRFRDTHAKYIITEYIKDSSSLNTILKSVIYNYLDFKVLESSDSNKSRRPTASWWLGFLDNVDKLRIANYLPESTITKKRNWLINSISRSQLMVYVSDLDLRKFDVVTSDFILELLKKGSDSLDKSDLQLINDYRDKNKLERLTFSDIKDYINALETNIAFVNVEKL